MFIIGNGVKVSNCEKEVKKLIKKLNIPYIPTWACLDTFLSSAKLNAGTFGVAATRHGNFAIQNSDLLIGMGVRLSSQLIGSNSNTFSPKSKNDVV